MTDLDPRRMSLMQRFYFKLCIRYRASHYKTRYERLIIFLSTDRLVKDWKYIYDEALIDF